jgi:hypothetical protein
LAAGVELELTVERLLDIRFALTGLLEERLEIHDDPLALRKFSPYRCPSVWTFWGISLGVARPDYNATLWFLTASQEQQQSA